MQISVKVQIETLCKCVSKNKTDETLTLQRCVQEQKDETQDKSVSKNKQMKHLQSRFVF